MKPLLILTCLAAISTAALAAPPTRSEKLTAQLLRAASTGDVPQIRRLMRAGADPNARNKNYANPLEEALKKHRFGTADVLRSYGADFSRSRWAVFNVVGDADLPSMAYLIKRGLKPDLFFNSAGYSLLCWCIQNSVFDDGEGNRETATRLKAVEMLLQAGANPNLIDKAGSGAIHDAAQRGSLSLTKLLLRYGADVNIPDNDGDTPLILNVSPTDDGFNADAGQRREVRQLLLKRGAKVNARNKRGARPLHLAIAHGSMNAFDDLVARGADINGRGWQDTTPLHTAMRYGSVAAAKKLLALGANPTQRDARGLSALDYQAAARLPDHWELGGDPEEGETHSAEEMPALRAEIARLIKTQKSDSQSSKVP